MTDTPPIVVVDDDADLRSLVAALLEDNGYAVVPVRDGKTLREAMHKNPHVALIVLDLNLPGEDGLSLCRWLHGAAPSVPIIMLTARGDPIDRIVGLELGADDYLAKPFEPRELLARIRSVRRRADAVPHAEPAGNDDGDVAFGAWRLDRRRRHLVRGDGTLVPLSGAEYRLLSALLARPGEVLARETLHQLAGGAADAALDRSVDIRISRLRGKLGDDASGSAVIKTVRGRGYVLSERVTRC